MAAENEKVFKKLGIDVWHELGYDGSLGLSATGERPYICDRTDGWWTTPFTLPDWAYNSDHALSTALVFHEVAPGRKLVYLPASQVKNEYNLYFKPDGMQYAKANRVDTIFCSFKHEEDATFDGYLSEVPYLTYINSAGNDTWNKATRLDYIYSAGALVLSTEQPHTYSAKSEYVDFTVPVPVYIPSSKGVYYPFNGTSCAAPLLSGMCALINHFFIEKTYKPLTRDMMYQFLKDNSADVWDEGKDDRTGWGLPILPHPDTIDINKYAKKGGEQDDMTFPDTKGHWAEKNIDEITDLGLMSGYPSGNFKPDQYMTRAECATVLKKALDYIGNNK